jgi:hypothetical protein
MHIHQVKESFKAAIQKSDDLVIKELKAGEKYLEIIYINTISHETQLQDFLIKPFYEIGNSVGFLSYLLSHPRVKTPESKENLQEELIRGKSVLFFENRVFLLDVKLDKKNTVTETSVEVTILGPQTGFSESLPTNIGLIRQRYPENTLMIESTIIGSVLKTTVNILYHSKRVDKDVLKNVKEFLSSIEIEMFQSGEQLLDFTKKSKRTLFPTIMVTERPDRTVINIAAGKVILLVAGSPFAMLMPTVLKDQMSSMADIYQTYWIGKFLLIVRYIGLVTTITLPALYVALTSYNPEVFRVQLALSVAGSRHAVPYPSFIEVMIMLLMMELLMEASIRLPKAIGSTATTVGGLILGKNIKKQIHAVFQKIQRANVDPIGFGLHYRGRHAQKDDWKTWQRLYPDIKFKVYADINIADTGLVE